MDNDQWLTEHEEYLNKRIQEVYDYLLTGTEENLRPHLSIDPLINLVLAFKGLGRLQIIQGLSCTLGDEFDTLQEETKNTIEETI